MTDDPSALIVPFGKHQGLTVAELLERDPSYVQWLLSQNWLAQRFAELHAAIVTRGATTDDSPEHNKIQARFLDPEFRAATILASVPLEFDRTRYEWADVWKFKEQMAAWKAPSWPWGPKPKTEPVHPGPNPDPIITEAKFERAGIDVIVYRGFGKRVDLEPNIAIEIKPSLGDDYPTVMRQMSRLRARVLVIDQYNSDTLPLSTVREMFKNNGQILLTVQEILAKIPDAKISMGNIA